MMMKVKQHQQISAVEKKQSNNNNDSRSSTMTMATTTSSKVTNDKKSSSTTTTTAGSTLSNATRERLESSVVMLLDDNDDDDKFKKIEMDFNDALFMPKNDLLEFPPIDDDSNSIKLDKTMSPASTASQFEPRKVSITSNKSTLDDINLLNDELNLEDIFPLQLTNVDDGNNNNDDDDNNSNINHDDSFTFASFNDSSTAVDRLFMDDSDRSMDKILDDIIDVDEKINTTAKDDFVPSVNNNSKKKDSMLKSIVDDKLSQLPQNNIEQFNKLEQEKNKLLRRLMHIEQKSSSENMATKMGMGANNNIQQTTPTPMVVNSNNTNTNSNSMSSMNYYYDINNSNKNNTNSDNGTAETPLQNFLRGSKETSVRRRNSMGAMTSSSCATTNLPLHTPYTTTAMANQQDRRRIMRRNSLNAALGGSYQSAGMVVSSSKDHHHQHRIAVPRRRASIGAGAAKVQNRRISLSRSNSSGFGGSFSSLKYNNNKKNKKKNGSKKDLLDKGSSHSHRSIGSNDSGLFPTKRRGSCGSSHGLMGGGGAKYKLGGGGSIASRLGMVPYMITTTPASTTNNNGIIYAGNQQQVYQQQNDNGWPVESSSGSIAVNMLM